MSIFAVPVTRLSTVLDLGGLTPGTSYTFRLDVTDAAGSVGVAELDIDVNNAPTSGGLSITPMTGVAITTLFTFTMSNWIDEDLPLTYEFRYLSISQANVKSEVPLGNADASPSLNSAMGPGKAQSGYKVTMVGYVRDVYDAEARSPLTNITVKAVVVTQNYLQDLTNNVVGNAAQTGDVGALLQSVNAIAGVMNVEEDDDANDDASVAEAKQAIVSSIVTSLVSAMDTFEVRAGGGTQAGY